MKVQLEFRAPDQAPRVKLLASSRIDRLVDAVTDFVAQYRAPCMQEANGPVILLQEYNFDGDGRSRVMVWPTRDSADPQRAAQLSCIQHLVPNSTPTYPRSSLQKGEEGTLLAKMHFTAADQPPGIEWVAPPPHRDLRIAVERYTAGFRMPCLRNGPVDAMRVYKFVIDGSARTVLRDSTLIAFLGAAKRFSTSTPCRARSTYACPITVPTPKTGSSSSTPWSLHAPRSFAGWRK